MPCCFGCCCRYFICVSALCFAEKDAFTPGPQSVSVKNRWNTHTGVIYCLFLTRSPSKLACQERHWTLLNEYQRHRRWRRWRNSSSCGGTETRAHKERKCSFWCLWKRFYLFYSHMYVCAGVYSLGDRSHPCPEYLRGWRRGFQGCRQAEKEGQDVWWGNHG